jgi:hypothetical protein
MSLPGDIAGAVLAATCKPLIATINLGMQIQFVLGSNKTHSPSVIALILSIVSGYEDLTQSKL